MCGEIRVEEESAVIAFVKPEFTELQNEPGVVSCLEGNGETLYRV